MAEVSGLNDTMIMMFVFAAGLFAFIALRARVHRELWLLVLTVALFAVPRAGVVLRQVQLPLPAAHVLAAVSIIEWLLFRRNRRAQRSRTGYFFILYTGVVGIGLMVGLATGGNHLIAFLELCFYLFSIGLFFYVSETFWTPHQFMLFMRVVLVISVVVSVYGAAQRYLGTSILVDRVTYNTGGHDISRSYLKTDELSQRRVLSSYGDPNVLASQLVVFSAIAMALLVGKGVPGHMRFGCLVVLAANLVCVAFSGSRAGIIGLSLAGAGVLLWRTRWALVILPVLAIVGSMLLRPLLETELLNRLFYFEGLLDMSDLRSHFPAMSWQLLQATPFGAGLGNTVMLDSVGTSWSFTVLPAGGIWAGFNSFWLNLFSRLGLPGVLAFAVLIGVLCAWVWRHARYVTDPQVKAFLVGGLIGLAGQWVIWLANNTYMLPGGGLNYWFMMGMLVSGCRAYSSENWPEVLPLDSQGRWWAVRAGSLARAVRPGSAVRDALAVQK